MGGGGSKLGPPYSYFALQPQFLLHYGQHHNLLDGLRALEICREKVPPPGAGVSFPTLMEGLPALLPHALSAYSTHALFTFIGLLCSTKVIRGVNSPSWKYTVLSAAVLTVLDEIGTPLQDLLSRGLERLRLRLMRAYLAPQFLPLYYGGVVVAEALFSAVMGLIALAVMCRLLPDFRIKSRFRHVVVTTIVALFRSRLLALVPAVIRSGLRTAAALDPTSSALIRSTPGMSAALGDPTAAYAAALASNRGAGTGGAGDSGAASGPASGAASTRS